MMVDSCEANLHHCAIYFFRSACHVGTANEKAEEVLTDVGIVLYRWGTKVEEVMNTRKMVSQQFSQTAKEPTGNRKERETKNRIIGWED